MMIRIIDIETSGIDPAENGICEVGYCDLAPHNFGEPLLWEVRSGRGLLCNPGRPIPPGASAVHHLIDDDVVLAPPFSEIAGEIFSDPEITHLAAHNARFERSYIPDEVTRGLEWVCTYKAALRVWPDAPLHSNQGLRYWRRPEGLDRAIADQAHRAWQDAYVTAHLLRDMLNDGARLEQLVQWSGEPALQVTCHIGKWRGTPWREVDDGFLAWISDRDFDEDVLFTVRTEMERRQREYEQEQAAREPVEEPF